jgi:outer membrane protein TolC
VCLCFFLFICAGSALGQAAGAAQKEKLVLSLDECLHLALERNPDFLMARQEVQVKQAAATAAYGNFFPSIAFRSTLTMLEPAMVEESKQDISPLVGRPGATLQTVYSPLFTMGFAATYAIPGIPFFSDGAFGMANAAHDLALKDLDASKNKLDKTKRDVKAAVSKSFYQLKLSELMYALTRANDDRLKAYLDVAQRNFYEGRVSQYEFLRAQVQLANNQPDLLRTEHAVMLAKVVLLQKLALELDHDIETRGELRTEFIDIQEKDALARALANRSELQDIALGIEVLKLQDKLNAGGGRPQFAAFANYNWELRKKWSLFSQEERKLHGTWNAGLQMSIPISELINPASSTWKGGQQFDLGIKRMETMKQNLESLIGLEIRQNVLVLAETRKTIDTQRTALNLSTEGLRIARIAYGAGQLSNVELMDAELDFQRAQLTEYQAWYGYIAAKIDLYNAMGTL